jgi:hypothetical protein
MTVASRHADIRCDQAMNAKTITLPSSHGAMLSHPSEVAKLIIEAARTAPVNQ